MTRTRKGRRDQAWELCFAGTQVWFWCQADPVTICMISGGDSVLRASADSSGSRNEQLTCQSQRRCETRLTDPPGTVCPKKW